MQASKSVKNPGKQRQRLFNAPAHIRHKLMSAHLAPDLIKTHGIKSLPVRKGDTVRIMRGDREGFEGKISRVDLANYRVFIEGLTREKVDGTVIFVAVHPSKVLIKTLNLDDKWRKRTLQRKQPLEKREEAPTTAKPAKEAAKPAKEEAKPEEEKVKPAESKPKVAAAKPKRASKVKAEKPIEAKMELAEAKPEAPAEVKPAEKVEVVEEKPAAKKPRAPKKATEKAAEEKPAPTKPARKKPAAKPAKEIVTTKEKPAEAKATVEKPAKKAPAKKTPAKRKPKAAEETGGA
jgi:large subunit ribosomal protein L24